MTWQDFKKTFKEQFCYETEKHDRTIAYEFFDFRLTMGMTLAEYTNKFYIYKDQITGELSEPIALALYIHGLPPFMRKELDIMRIDSLNTVKQAAESIANANKALLQNPSTYTDLTINTFNYNNNQLDKGISFRPQNSNNDQRRYGHSSRGNHRGRHSYRGRGRGGSHSSRGYFKRQGAQRHSNFARGGGSKDKSSTSQAHVHTLQVEEGKGEADSYNEWKNPNDLYTDFNKSNPSPYGSPEFEIQLGNLHMPSTEQLGLAPSLISGKHHVRSLLDTGATADVVSFDTCQRLKITNQIHYYKETKIASAVDGRIPIIGYIKLSIKIFLTRGVIQDTRSFYVLESKTPLIIMGLPFIKHWKHQLTFEDFFYEKSISSNRSNECVITKPKVSISMFNYEEKYIHTLLTRKENSYYLCYINRVDTTKSQEKSQLKIDIELNNKKVNHLRNKILNNFKDVVTNDHPSKLPPNRKLQHRITLIEPQKVISRKQYPLSHQEKLELTRQVEELLKQGFIKESISPYNSPILFVKKKDNTMRMCIDFRLLNNNTVKDKFPLPNIEQITAQLGKASVYSKLDLMSGYYQVRVDKRDTEKTAFSTDYGHYEWVVMPFGLTNAPATFQRMMNETLRPYLGKFVQVYLDDIFIYSPTEESHYEHVCTVLECLRENKLIAKLKKCAFYFRELRFLGLVITPAGIKTDPEKIIKIRDWPTPTTIKEAQSFIGLATYYRRFIPQFARIATPIHNYISHKSKWNKEQNESLQHLKYKLTHTPVLVHPIWDPHYCFLVHTDACGTALGYTLEQLSPLGKSRGVIAYGSKKLVGSQLNYGIYDREFMAVIEALKVWRYYLMGRHFIIRTDHKSLIYLKNQNIIDSTRVARWLDYLSQYDFEIQYIKGKDNSAADALSRYPEIHHLKILEKQLDRTTELMINNINIPQTVSTMVPNLQFKAAITEAYKHDPLYSEIFDILKHKKTVPISMKHHIKHYKLQNNLLYYTTLLGKPNYRVLIPRYKDMINKVIAKAHSAKDAGHFGYWKTYLNLSDLFYWKNMVKSVKRYCNTCQVCQRNNTTTQKLQGLFMPLPVPEGRWTDVTMDFVTGLPTTAAQHDMIMVIVDRMSKMAHFIPTKKTLTAEQCAKLFIDFSFKYHGIPKRLVTDKDIRFTTKFWQTIHFLLGTSLLFSTTNHPQTDGQTERVNKSLTELLRKYCSNDFFRWDQYLTAIEFAYNSTPHESTKRTPFELAYGYNPDSFKKITINPENSKYSARAEDYFQRMQLILQQTQDNIVEAQRKQEIGHNKKRREHTFKVGDFILLNRDAFGSNKQYYKIQPAFHGPFKLVKKINDNAFEVDLPSMNKKDRVMNVQWFKTFKPPAHIHWRVPETEAEVNYRIEEMTGIAGHNPTEKTYDVYWKDSDPFHVTTITEQQFNMASPTLRTCLLFNARLIKEHEQV